MKKAIEDKQLKTCNMFTKNPEEKLEKFSEEVKFQEIAQIHADNKRKYNKIKPLTILITKDIKACKDLIGKFQKFLMRYDRLSMEQAEAKTLIVTSSKEHDQNRSILKRVDEKSNTVEYIFSFSDVNGGLGCKKCFSNCSPRKTSLQFKITYCSQVLGEGTYVSLKRSIGTDGVKVRVHNHIKCQFTHKKFGG